MIDIDRVLRTVIQSSAGAGIALLTAVGADHSKEATFTALVEFAVTVAIAVLMNIKNQTKEEVE